MTCVETTRNGRSRLGGKGGGLEGGGYGGEGGDVDGGGWGGGGGGLEGAAGSAAGREDLRSGWWGRLRHEAWGVTCSS
jgi:hypothetical protein